MKQLKLISPIPPSVNNYLNYRVAGGKKKFVQSYPSTETKAYKSFFLDYVINEMEEQNWEQPKTGKQVFVECIFYLERKRKDPNNLLKVTFDVLSEAGVYVDDDIALPIVPRLYIDSNNPRIEITIYESEAIGIFNDEEDLKNFTLNNCDKCKRNILKCGVLKNALENRITENINDRICQKIKPMED